MTAREIGSDFDLPRMLNHGYLPRMYEAGRPSRLLDAYIADYLREETAAENLVRNLPAFAGFLDAAALGDGAMVNCSTIARECGVSSNTVKGYFQFLEDALLGRSLPAWRKRPKRRTIGAPKFYFADVGVVNRLARRRPAGGGLPGAPRPAHRGRHRHPAGGGLRVPVVGGRADVAGNGLHVFTADWRCRVWMMTGGSELTCGVAATGAIGCAGGGDVR